MISVLAGRHNLVSKKDCHNKLAIEYENDEAIKAHFETVFKNKNKEKELNNSSTFTKENFKNKDSIIQNNQSFTSNVSGKDKDKKKNLPSNLKEEDVSFEEIEDEDDLPHDKNEDDKEITQAG